MFFRNGSEITPVERENNIFYYFGKVVVDKMERKKTIAFYIGDLGRGGAERVIINLSRYFYSNDYIVYLVTKSVDSNEYDVPEGVERIVADITAEEESSLRIVNLLKRIVKLRKIWKRIKPNVIVSFIRKNNLMAIVSSMFTRIPVLVSIRTDPKLELEDIEKISFFVFRFADGIICQTALARDYLPKYLRKKAVILPNSLTKEFIRTEYNPNRRPEIVTIGRMIYYKNQRMLLEAFRDIMEDYPEWSLSLYGEGDTLEELKKEYACDRIVFHGKVNDIMNRIENASIFALPSDQEGIPNALFEAMALGLACISTDCPCGGPADLIEDGVDGYLIPVDDKAEMKRYLAKLIENEDIRIMLGKNAIKIAKKYDPQTVNRKWFEYIDGFVK